MAIEPDLDDPEYARFAWARYRTLMRWVTFTGIVATCVVLGILHLSNGPLPIFMTIAVAGGVMGTVMLGGALMGLMFLSSGTGHDQRVEDPLKDEYDIDN